MRFCNTHTSALLSHHQRSFLLPQMATNTETHSQTSCKEWDTLEHSALKWISPSNPSPQGSGNPMEKEAGGTGETKEIEDTRRARPSTTTVQSSCELTRPGQHAQTCAGLHQMLCLYCNFKIGVFIKSLSVKTSRSLFIVPSLGLFSFCWFCPIPIY